MSTTNLYLTDPDRWTPPEEATELRDSSAADAVWVPRVDLISGLIAKSTRPASLFALPGVGKGTFAIYVALCLLNNRPIFGRSVTPVDWVAYVDGEDERPEFDRRVIEIAAGLGVTRDERFRFLEVPFRLTYDARVDEVDHRPEFAEWLGTWYAHGSNGLVIYDSAQALFGGNQATGETGDDVYIQVKHWAQRFGHTPLIIDHTAYKTSIAKPTLAHEYGSVHKRARVSNSLLLWQREASRLDAWTLLDVYNVKSNSHVVEQGGTPVPDLSFKVAFEGERHCTTFTQAAPPSTEGRPSLDDRIIAAMPGTYRSIALAVGITEASVQPRLTGLKRGGRADNPGGIWTAIATERL